MDKRLSDEIEYAAKEDLMNDLNKPSKSLENFYKAFAQE